MNRIVQLILIVLICSSAFAEEQPRTVKIGLLASLSDEWAEVSNMTLKGTELALSEIGRSPKFKNLKFKVVVEDSAEANGAAQAVTAFRKLRSEGVKFFIGPMGTPAALALAPIIKSDTEAVFITPSVGISDFHSSCSRIFNSRGVDDINSRRLAGLVYSKGIRSTAIFSSQQPWEKVQADAFAEKFLSRGGKISLRVDPLPQDTDLKTHALKIVQSNPDSIFISTYNLMGLAAKELRQAGFVGQFFSVNVDQSRLKISAGSLEGDIFASFQGSSEAFQDKFQKVYKIAPSLTADTSYDAMWAFAEAILHAEDYSSNSIASALKEVKFSGSGGDFGFLASRQKIQTTTFWQVKENKIIPLKYN